MSLPEGRIDRLQAIRSEIDADALWISSLPHIRWACGFSGSNGLLVVRRDGAHFLSDARYMAQAAREVRGVEIHVRGPDLTKTAAEEDVLAGCRSVVFESDNLTVAVHDALQGQFSEVEWVAREQLLAQAVASKDRSEVDAIRAAQRITEEVFGGLLDWIHPGRTEKEIAAEVVYQHLRRGAERMAFEPIVASGPNGALPHARPSDRRLEHGDVLLLDFGCVLDGYASDMTRTVALGEVDPEARTVYDVVREAQEQAIAAARAGMRSNELDAVARRVIEHAGYGVSFTHGLGHGIGLQTHEWPRVSPSTDYALPFDVVVSIEPGIYLPDRFGIRIEDLIVLRDEGADVLTQASKEWIVL